MYPTASLMTDRYEFSMLQTFIEEGMVDKKVTFEVFTRRLAPGHRYGVFAGLGRVLPMLEDFRFDADQIAYLLRNGSVNEETAQYLKGFVFEGTIDAYREGDLYFPYSPVLTVNATLGEALLVETPILSVLNFDSGIAGKAARIREVARGSRLIEMGSRRTHEEAAVAAARAAYIAGFDTTSNLRAGEQWGIPTAGTAAHAFTLAFEDEDAAFAAQIRSHGPETTLLIDTYDVAEGVHNAVAAWQTVARENAGEDFPPLGAVRIDSGDLAANARLARGILDDLGFEDTKIVVTSDLDEHVIKDLLYQNAPIDGYGVGTKLVAAPSAGFVYKMVAIEEKHPDGGTYMRPVAKKSADKVSVGGKKIAFRTFDNHDKISGEVLTTDTKHIPEGRFKPLQFVAMEAGIRTDEAMQVSVDVDAARKNFRDSIRALPEGERSVWSGTDHGPFLTATHA